MPKWYSIWTYGRKEMMPKPLIFKRGHALVPLSQDKFAIIDVEDAEEIGKYNWHLNNHGYAVRKSSAVFAKPAMITMHRVINNTLEGFDTDHIDGNRINNIKSNLRSATRSQNMQNANKIKTNTSGYKGVGWHKSTKKWQAQIQVSGKQMHLGYFNSASEAAKAYDRKAVEFFGEFARINFD